jgi:hypothetical protein
MILVPILLAWRTGMDRAAQPDPAGGTPPPLTNPKAAALISASLLLFIALLGFLVSLGWEPLRRLMNGPDPTVFYAPGQYIAFGLLALPIAAGIIAGRPIVHTLQTGGSLFAHKLNFVLVVFILFAFASGLTGLVLDQWPCFIGVPNCD